jgi:hypothetical protein
MFASKLNRSMAALAAVAAGWMCLAGSNAHAVIVHQYLFRGNANDSVGTAHGTVVDGGAPNAVFTAGGELDLSSNPNQGSDTAGLNAAYVNLPNGIVKAAALGGTPGAISMEWWATVTTQRTWQRLGDFGTSNAGEDRSDGGANTTYMLVTPNSGRGPAGMTNGVEMSNHHDPTAAAGGDIEPTLGLAGPFPLNVEQHVVAIWDKNDTTLGPGGTMRLYLNGDPVNIGDPGQFGQTQGGVPAGAIAPGFDFNTLVDNNNWLGRSQWNDPVFTGRFNEFRIYDHALSDAEVAASFAAGPVPIPEPATMSLALVGLAAWMAGRRRRP